MTATFDTQDGRSVVRMERLLAHPPERVWTAVTEPAGLAAWFPSAVTIDLRVGGMVSFDFGGDGVVTDLAPPRVLGFTWGGDHLRFEVEPAGTGTRFRLVHTFDDRAGAASFAAGWHTCLAALEESLAGRPPGGHGLDHVALHERYVREFGLDAPVAVRVADGWRVRVERQLTRPAAVVEPVLPQPAGGTQWELGPGTGHGARLLVTWTGPDTAGRDAALAQLPGQITELLARIS